MKKNLLIIILLIVGIRGYSQTVNVPYGEYAVRVVLDPYYPLSFTDCYSSTYDGVVTFETYMYAEVYLIDMPNISINLVPFARYCGQNIPNINMFETTRYINYNTIIQGGEIFVGRSVFGGHKWISSMPTPANSIDNYYLIEFPKSGYDSAVLYDGYMHVHIYPKEINIYSRNPNNNMINADFPTNDKIELAGTRGFYDGTYQWYYSFNPSDDNSWIYLPNYFQNKDVIQLSGRDLFGDGVMDTFAIHPNIHFSVRPPLTINSNIPLSPEFSNVYKTITLATKQSAPQIEYVNYEMPSCHGKDDAKLIIKFDRALFSNLGSSPIINEGLYVSIEGNRFLEPDTIKNQIIDPITLEYVIENLPADTFNIDVLGVIYYDYGNGIVDTLYTYTTGSQHRDSIIIRDRPALKLESTSTDSIHCYGGWDGKINVKMSGGVDKFNTYLKTNNVYIDTINNFITGATATFTDLSAGTYIVSVADTNGCKWDENGDSIVKSIIIGQPDASVRIDGYEWQEPKCFRGSDGWAEIYIKGGTPPYTVEWRDSANVLIPNTISIQPDYQISRVENIKSSTYYVTVRDSHYSLAMPANELNCRGCYDTISFFVTEPPLLEVSIEERHYVTCYGDADGVLVAHGTGGRKILSGNPYNYEWNKITNGVSSAIGTNDSVLSDLYSGHYSIKITDRNSICIAYDTVYLAQPDTLTVTTQVLQNVLCNGENTGAIIALPQGGTPPYTYVWTTNETTQEIQNLSIGGYVVYVRDARYVDNGKSGHYCNAQAQAFITSPNGLEFNATVTSPTCNGYSDGSIILNVTGGVAPYSYLWGDGSSESSRTGLSSGVYTLSITDANGCIISDSYTLDNPDVITVNLGKDITLCKNQTIEIDGTISEDATYEWTNATGSILSTSAKYEFSTAGIYTLTATTTKGCTGSDEIVISQSNDEIDVDFVIATTVANNAKLYAVNITRLSLDNIEWIIPNEAIVFEETDDRIQLLFTQNGTYIVGLTGYKGLCEKTMYKTITVVDSRDITEDESSEPFLKRFIVVPNPNDGNFEAIIELREPVDFKLILYDMSGSIIETTQTYNAMSKTIPFNRSVIGAGTYILKFVSSKTTSTFKVLIQ